MRKQILPSACLTALILTAAAAPSFGQAKVCKPIKGTITETILPQETAPNDPFGRILGMFSGDIAGFTKAALTAFLVTPPTFSPGPPSSVSLIQVRHAISTGPGDVITTLGKASFNLASGTLPGQADNVASVCPRAPCIVQVPQMLDITGGTGRWAGATGQLRNVGVGNLNLPQGQGHFAFLVEGEVCLPATGVTAKSVSQKE